MAHTTALQLDRALNDLLDELRYGRLPAGESRDWDFINAVTAVRACNIERIQAEARRKR